MIRLLALLLLVPVLLGAAAVEPLEVDRHERLLVIAPHPDDETLAAGGLMQQVLAAGGSVRVVLLTAGDGYVEAVAQDSGDPRPKPVEFLAFGERRLGETRGALRLLGNGAIRLTVLGFPDGGLDALLTAHRDPSRPWRSRTTDATHPPYAGEVANPAIRYDGEDLERELVRILRETRPTLIVLPDPLDRHPDHAAGGQFTLDAVAQWESELPKRERPDLAAYLIHWPNWPPGWNAPDQTPRPDAPLELPPDFQRPGRRTVVTLTPEQAATKIDALSAYATQQAAMGQVLDGFARQTEPFVLLERESAPKRMPAANARGK
ncbi:MAG: PIG-L family deacetylase [Deltaproteobacteria bacterium]|nr:PIG-L family deacetylase [Deltaproteobacteria bacterium]